MVHWRSRKRFNTIQYDIDLKPQIARSSPIHREYRYIKWLI